jgi:hypothetical protein
VEDRDEALERAVDVAAEVHADHVPPARGERFESAAAWAALSAPKL